MYYNSPNHSYASLQLLQQLFVAPVIACYLASNNWAIYNLTTGIDLLRLYNSLIVPVTILDHSASAAREEKQPKI